jgi:hypothetical protein
MKVFVAYRENCEDCVLGVYNSRESALRAVEEDICAYYNVNAITDLEYIMLHNYTFFTSIETDALTHTIEEYTVKD